MTTDSSIRFLVLAALDGSPHDPYVAGAAAAIAERFPKGELHLLHVLDPPPQSAQSAAMFDGGRVILEAAARIARPVFTRATRAHLTVGTPWKEVVRLGSELEADLVLVGTHDHAALYRLALGSVAEQVVRHASCPVLLVRPKEESLAPEIEPPCTECLRTRAESSRARYWCARHSEHHPHGHLHYEVPESFGVGSMLLRP